MEAISLMSAVLEQPIKTPQRRLNSAQRSALIAAVATGMSQREAAERFGVHPNTVFNMVKAVKAVQSTANPLNKVWKEAVVTKLQSTMERGLDCASDPIGAMNGAIKIAHGIGYLQTGTTLTHQGTVNVQFAWNAPQPAEYEQLEGDVPVDVDHTSITDAT